MRRTALGSCLFVLAACTGKPEPKAPASDSALTLSIVSTNDVHGQLGRLPYVAGAVRNLRAARQKDGGGVVLVDGGDAFQGTLESNLNEGAAILDAYKVMGYAAMTVGNHEFDFGPVGPASIPISPGDDAQGALKRRIHEASFPFLAANLLTEDGRFPSLPDLHATAEVVVAGIRVGIVGLLTAGASDVIKKSDFVGLRVAPLAETAAREARALRARGVNAVIVLAHAGGSCTSTTNAADISSCEGNSEIFELARALPPGLVDAIFGGHRNATVAHVVAGIPVVHAASHLVAFSRVDLTLDPKTKRVTGSHVFAPHPVCSVALEQGCNPEPYEGAPVVADPATLAAVQPALETARSLRDKPLAVHVAAPFPVDKRHETALGNLFADLMREAIPGAEAAFGNAGSVRDVLPPGDLTYGQLHHVMPFDNQLAKLRLKGSELRRLVQANLTGTEHGVLSLSGLSVKAQCEGGSVVVELRHPDGAAVRDDEDLLVVTNDFLALGGDGLLAAAGLMNVHVDIDVGTTALAALISGMERRKTLAPTDPALFSAERPRLKYPGEWPVRCDVIK